jgi:hypothetical protein
VFKVFSLKQPAARDTVQILILTGGIFSAFSDHGKLAADHIMRRAPRCVGLARCGGLLDIELGTTGLLFEGVT